MQQRIELEREGLELLRLLYDRTLTIDLLARALQLGHRLKALLQNNTIANSIGDDPATSLLLALRVAVNAATQSVVFQVRDVSDRSTSVAAIPISVQMVSRF
jgi:hypothetical protein